MNKFARVGERVSVNVCVYGCVCMGVYLCMCVCAKERKKKSEVERVRERFCLNLCVQLEKGRFIIQHGAQDFWIILFWFCEKQTLRERERMRVCACACGVSVCARGRYLRECVTFVCMCW